ncbi:MULTISPECIES: acetyl-CoA carboxylase biotin carboxyl carrier protein subunit [unclassified Sinorhizobium]|uniref:acetyl-CoA carboxylase biotin carboxyl carrier protein n=1 Tax=unclassified Sinorhizobium TaxID=2613772 RepID=UPI0024C4562C|nr:MULTISPECIES: acetyl-CoA carboxylase biotin carboxyl carrier protein subunit [unclassified Sinorhizobium]MDK1377593.1 acetyl-CoA carboxylase biotin carboxyl carrier protein subunit [Sinorhizobium sp. 6-70]MDK1483029.1 acetyl-CoA carboxylase biotin carboxyl carrier protein subunit [Sinorhizobium sp. 6-117]
MDLSKIKTLIEFVGRSNITELTVREKDTTVRIFRERTDERPLEDESVTPSVAASSDDSRAVPAETGGAMSVLPVTSPIFGVLHVAPAPGEAAFVKEGDEVEEGQTLFIIEAMKVLNRIAAPRAGCIARIAVADATEVEAGQLLAEIA